MPFGTVLDPIYASSTSSQITGYTRCGDSALWTGAYLAAESFRYKVTGSADALNNVNAALSGLKALTDVTGDNRLARCMVLANSPFAAGIASEEAANTVHQSLPWIWLDNTSRDEVVGAFFGLGVAFDMVDDPNVKAAAASLAARLIGFVSKHNWTPNDDIDNTFVLRPEELAMLIQVSNHLNPQSPTSGPPLTLPFDTGVKYDVLSNSSYFKFNLDYMSFCNLIRLQNSSTNQAAYVTVRNYTSSHGNAFFDLVDRGIQGANAARDAEALTLLGQWLLRPRRDPYVDLTSTVPVCGAEACQPVPVALRPPTDFLWQRDPFQLTGGGSGLIESAGIDYILPWWMARYYGLASAATVQSAAAPVTITAPGSLASLFSTNLDSATTLTVTDSTGAQRPATLLYVSSTQINFLIPPDTATGLVQIAAAGSTVTSVVGTVAPTLFSMNGNGSGVAAAIAISVKPGAAVQSPIPVFSCAAGGCTSVPINLAGGPVYLSLYGTGIRNRTSLGDVTVTIHGTTAPLLYAGPAPGFDGLDQVNVSLPPTLALSGESNVVVSVAGQTSNMVTINLQ